MKHVGSAARPGFCVLVTGFGAFPGARANPTIAILNRLKLSRTRLAHLGIDLRWAVMPVVYAEIEDGVKRLVTEHRPDAVLHLGLASRRKVLCVETRAMNRASPLHPDASGRWVPNQTLAMNSRHALVATYPATQILTAIRHAGLPVRYSIDAGDYVCNATFYRSLATTSASQVGFLHVPRPRGSRPLSRAQCAKPTVDALSRAALAAILVMARQRHGRLAAGVPKVPPPGERPAGR